MFVSIWSIGVKHSLSTYCFCIIIVLLSCTERGRKMRLQRVRDSDPGDRTSSQDSGRSSSWEEREEKLKREDAHSPQARGSRNTVFRIQNKSARFPSPLCWFFTPCQVSGAELAAGYELCFGGLVPTNTEFLSFWYCLFISLCSCVGVLSTLGWSDFSLTLQRFPLSRIDLSNLHCKNRLWETFQSDIGTHF